MYFCKYLKDFGIDPIVITVDEKKASYRFIDSSFNEKIAGLEVHLTNTWEPLKLYSRITSGDKQSAIPIGFSGESKPTLFQKISRAIRGNLFIPDSRVGWVSFALKKAREILTNEEISLIITTGPPHSTHLVGLKLKSEFNITWLADFRDPWTDLYYNRFLYRTRSALNKDKKMEQRVLRGADLVLTVGPSMAQHLIEKGNIDASKVSFIYNGYDETDFKGVECAVDPACFTICFVGMLTESQPITAFLTALKHFYSINHSVCKHLKFRIVGNVSSETIQEIKRVTPELLVEYIGYVQKKKAISYMLSADLLFNSLAEMGNSELLISGKLMEYIAANKPILCLGNPNGDAANLLNEFDYCKVFDRSEEQQIVDYLSKIFSFWINKTTFINKSEKYLLYSRYETTRQLADLIKKYV
jgi:glycosyltransferase involved in cell wall biosynthesis